MSSSADTGIPYREIAIGPGTLREGFASLVYKAFLVRRRRRWRRRRRRSTSLRRAGAAVGDTDVLLLLELDLRHRVWSAARAVAGQCADEASVVVN